MASLEYKPIRGTNDAGELIAAGGSWTALKNSHELVNSLGFAFSAAFIGAVFLMFGSEIGALLMLVAAFFLIKGIVVSQQRPVDRAVFRKDGSISLSLAGRWRQKSFKGIHIRPHSDIRSIEVGRSNFGHHKNSVEVITADGATFCWADPLWPNEARQVAIGLTGALDEMRRSIANAQLAGHSTVPGNPGVRVID